MSEPRVIIALAVETDDEFVWDRLRRIQIDMFAAGEVAIKFCYFAAEGAQAVRPLVSTRWVTDSNDLWDLMDHARAHCVCGCYVRADDILAEALKEAKQGRIQAIVIIGDRFYGDRNEALAHARQLRAAGTRLFVFRQGGARSISGEVFRALAEATDGAYHEFDAAVERVDERLPRMLEAVAHYAVGGPGAMRALADPSADLLLEQMNQS
jgi:hypothetical protein